MTSAPIEEPAVVFPAKVVRLDTMIDALREELRAIPLEAGALTRVCRVYAEALAEVGSTLSDDLLRELAALQAGPRAAMTADEVRILVIQLDGWLAGLLLGMHTGLVPYALPAPIDLRDP